MRSNADKCMQMHTNAHKYACECVQMHLNAFTCIPIKCIRMRPKNVFEYVQMHSNAPKMHSHAFKCMHKCMQMQTNAPKNEVECVQMHQCLHMHLSARTCSQMHANAFVCALMHTNQMYSNACVFVFLCVCVYVCSNAFKCI